MYNTMSGGNVADKLGLGSEVRELKFGSSFTSGGRGQQQGSFHSVRYVISIDRFDEFVSLEKGSHAHFLYFTGMILNQLVWIHQRWLL